MAHKMDGTWTYFEALKKKPPHEDGTMLLVIPDNGRVDEAKSKHKTKKLSGTATDNGIELVRGEPQEKRDYVGRLIFDGNLLGERVMVIIGTWKNNPTGGAKAEREEITQNEGVWIITKP